jgi:phospholipase/carboxylesterase
MVPWRDMTIRRMRLGDLDARVSVPEAPEGPDGAGPVVVLLHGFGAPGDDLVPLGEWLDAPAGTRFVFPEAPLELHGLYGDARAWWMIDLESLAGGPVDRSGEVPDGLAPARAKLIGLLDAVRDQLGVADHQVVLGGFSQGAILTLDVALHTERAFAGLALLSGTLLAERVWAPRMAARRGLPVLQSHGDQDGILSYAAAGRLRDALLAAGLDVEWHSFHGGHEIPPDVLRALGRFLTARL